MIQGGIWGRMLLCTFVREIADSWRMGSTWKTNGLMVFSFSHTVVCICIWRCSRKLGWMGRISVLWNTAEPIFHIWVVGVLHGLRCINWLLAKFWRLLRPVFDPIRTQNCWSERKLWIIVLKLSLYFSDLLFYEMNCGLEFLEKNFLKMPQLVLLLWLFLLLLFGFLWSVWGWLIEVFWRFF